MPITGSWSAGERSVTHILAVEIPNAYRSKYARTSSSVSLQFLSGLRPKTEYVRLFREIVVDVWKSKQTETKAASTAIQKRIDDIEDKRQRLLEAHVYQENAGR